jgi:hypothetical protein
VAQPRACPAYCVMLANPSLSPGLAPSLTMAERADLERRESLDYPVVPALSSQENMVAGSNPFSSSIGCC